MKVPQLLSCTVFLIAICWCELSYSQVNFLGKPGLIRIPTATNPYNLEKISFSLAYLPEAYSINNFMFKSDDELFYTVQVQPLSWLSVNFVLTRLLNTPRIGIGDRHLDIQFFILNEDKHGINLSAIVSPASNASFIDHNALILSKAFSFDSKFSISPTVGYSLKKSFRKPLKKFDFENEGYQWIDRKLFGNSYLYGFFSGVQFEFDDKIFFNTEYDGEYLNFSLSAMILKKLNIHFAYLDFTSVTGYFSYSVFLNKSRLKKKGWYE